MKSVHPIKKPVSSEELAGRSGRILVVDDDADVRGFLRTILAQAGYTVVEACDGKQAFREALAGSVDMVITDLVMPEQEGIETIRRLRRSLPAIGIIAISGAFGGRFLEVAKILGADAVLSKPVAAETLLAKVAEVLDPQQ
jgi:CheY-like chemotaxis protein